MSAKSQTNFNRFEESSKLKYEKARVIAHAQGRQHHSPDNQDYDTLITNHHTTGHALTEHTGLAWSEVKTKQSRLAHATTD